MNPTVLTLTSRALAVAMAMMLASAAAAATYYVAPPPGGSDGNAGTLAAPWATLQHAADVVAAGDTVLVRAGNYVGAYLDTSGTPTAPITFAAYPGEVATIDADNPVTADGFNIEGADWVVIDGLAVTAVTRAGIRAVLCANVTIRNVHAYDNGRWGIFTGFCDDLLIEGNETSGSVIEHGIYVSNSGDRPVIRGNRVHHNNANGIHMNGDESAGGDGIISEAVVEGNLIWGNGTAGGSGINCDGVQSSLIRNNVIYDQHASGISLYRIDGAEPSTNNRVLNNSVHLASDGRWALNIQNGSTGNEIVNNTLWSDQGFRGAIDISADSLPGLVSDYNAVEDRFTTDDSATVLTLAQWRSQTGGDANSFVASPSQLFVAPGSDYHLRTDAPASPAIDAGQTRADVPTDLEGTSRPSGAAFDIGAYELVVGGIFADGFESGGVTMWSGSVP